MKVGRHTHIFKKKQKNKKKTLVYVKPHLCSIKKAVVKSLANTQTHKGSRTSFYYVPVYFITGAEVDVDAVNEVPSMLNCMVVAVNGGWGSLAENSTK